MRSATIWLSRRCDDDGLFVGVGYDAPGRVKRHHSNGISRWKRSIEYLSCFKDTVASCCSETSIVF